ncbi:MAG TPA: GFA family protein [Burkholderiales bacterium]|nr:GFA family protein [Burkholderiales bacterium]
MVGNAYTGGCLCGRIRYRASGKPSDETHCHCVTCRRASGAAFVSWATFKTADFAFTKTKPARFDSSDIAFRQFCPSCGTQLTFQFHKSPQKIDVTLASLDDPGAITPVDHIWTKRQIPWIKLEDGLPRHVESRPSEDK